MATPSTTAYVDPASASARDATWRRVRAAAVVVLLAGSAVAVVIATTAMPATYSWIRHSVSESAGQGVADAWIARLGFLLLGFAVLLLAGIAARRWGPVATVLFRVYGASMIATAAFAHRPWLDVPFDTFEDSLHSLTANLVGFTFTVGVLVVAVGRGPGTTAARAFDALAVAAAIIISLMVLNVAGTSGLAQRIMFGIGYVWFGLEAVRAAGGHRRMATNFTAT
jgi:hypothetical protein